MSQLIPAETTAGAADSQSYPGLRPRASPGPRTDRALTLNLTRAGLGLAHLLFPRLGVEQLTGRAPGLGAEALIRALGARQLAQALLTLAVPRACTFRLGAATDALHAASMLALARLSPSWRRAAVVDGTIAALLAAAGAVVAARGPSVGGRRP